MNLSAEQAGKVVSDKLSRFFSVGFADATDEQIYKAVAMSVRDILLDKKNTFNAAVRRQGAKKVYYLCLEFLIGRNLKNNLCNLNLEKAFSTALKKRGYDLSQLYELEVDPGLGNGGLGRLAACFMDAAAALDYPATGYSLFYQYGLFKQKIVDMQQIELPDAWLGTGEAWLLPRTDRKYKVRFGGHVSERWENGVLKIEHAGGTVLEATPYDMMLSGEGGSAVSTLRLWRARSAGFDLSAFSMGGYAEAIRAESEAELITKVLYPSDDHYTGKLLRLNQQYFLVSASLQDIIRDHLKYYGTLDTLPDKAAVHINDTHPALVIPELMRILMDEYNFSWEKAWGFTVRITAYTNHTVMAEALEQWAEETVAGQLPRLYSIIKEIDNRLLKECWEKFPGDVARQERVAILGNSRVRMANLSVAGSHCVNGVSQLHTDIIKGSIFKDFYDMTPGKFLNITNGIAHRRWLCQSNPRLNALIKDLIGDGFVRDASELGGLLKFKDDRGVLKELAKIKTANKRDFSDFVRREQGVTLDPDSRFDTQIKRLHEYKRQLLNVLRIISLYSTLRDKPDFQVSPQTFIFGAKSASGYSHAKRIITLINALSAEIRADKRAHGKLNVLFLENYNVSKAERIIPASEISEQISLAGKEASGTSNMKFMLNGALTMGTLDGANVEIGEAVGRDHIFIFGMTKEEVARAWEHGYYASAYYANNPKIRAVVDALKAGFNGESFSDIADYLVLNTLVSDPYMNLADFDSYLDACARADAAYADPLKWNASALVNISAAGRFAADRSVAEYARKVWNLERVKV